MAILREPEWTSDHAIALRHFLESPAGIRLLEMMEWDKPGYGSKIDPTSRLVISGVHEGYELFQSTMISRIVVKDPNNVAPPEGGLPPLEDDRFWTETDRETEKEIGPK